ncbi:MAG: biotin synthase BioB [Gammaproteobacteria bacterium]|nr:biotin synthase BioB [Gammaproteobacteria bacterium]MCW5583116.1 biotin synthase BioB [Gammaproteobacteria bacterium]
MTQPQWDSCKAEQIYELPLMELIFRALSIHTQHFNVDEIELCSLLSIKTGACPEDCAYCPQSAHYQTDVERENLLPLEVVIAEAKKAKASGAKRFCMGAAWRNPPKKNFSTVIDMIKAVKNIGLETCVTLGMLNQQQALELRDAGLDFYNHNLDTSPEYYKKIITTRTYSDRIKTLHQITNAGIHVCCGGIIGMGETRQDRIALLVQLANLPKSPKSVPINRLIPFKGTPLETSENIDNIEFVRTIATTRIMLPTSIIRLSAGRIAMSEEMQALCFIAGANSIWLGNKLLTAKNPNSDSDMIMLKKMGFKVPHHA